MTETEFRSERSFRRQPFVTDIAELLHVLVVDDALIHHMDVANILPRRPIARVIDQMRILTLLLDHEFQRTLRLLRPDSAKAQHCWTGPA